MACSLSKCPFLSLRVSNPPPCDLQKLKKLKIFKILKVHKNIRLGP